MRAAYSFMNIMAAFFYEKVYVNWPSGGVHFDLRMVSVSKTSFPVVSDWFSL